MNIKQRVTEILKTKIKEEVTNVYNSYFESTENIILEEFSIDKHLLYSSCKKKPLPYLRVICSNYLKNKGVPVTVIGKRYNKTHSTIIIADSNYNDYYKYIPEFRELADRFNNKLKEIQDGTNE